MFLLNWKPDEFNNMYESMFQISRILESFNSLTLIGYRLHLAL
jgi:hypothetical protein